MEKNDISPLLAIFRKIFLAILEKFHNWPPREKILPTPILRQQVQ